MSFFSYQERGFFARAKDKTFCNELQSLKYEIKKRLCSFGLRNYGGSICLTRKHIDLPLSVGVFQKNFSSLFPDWKTLGRHRKRLRSEISVENLTKIFGKDWNLQKFHNSSTQVKIIGTVVLLYRQKCPPYMMIRYCNNLFI